MRSMRKGALSQQVIENETTSSSIIMTSLSTAPRDLWSPNQHLSVQTSGMQSTKSGLGSSLAFSGGASNLSNDTMDLSYLREALHHARQKLDAHVQEQKQQCDAVCSTLQQTRAVHQEAITTAVTNLLAVELEGGLRVSSPMAASKGSSLSSSSLLMDNHHSRTNFSHTKQELQEQQQSVQEDMTKIQSRLSEKKQKLEGTIQLRFQSPIALS
jgi:hypothetical protein